MDLVIKNCTLLGVSAKAYEINGKSGVSYKADLVFKGGVATFKTTEEVYKDVGEKKNLECDVVLSLESYKMDYVLKLKEVSYE